MSVLGVVILCLFMAIGVVQVVKPQLLWRINRPF